MSPNLTLALVAVVTVRNTHRSIKEDRAKKTGQEDREQALGEPERVQAVGRGGQRGA